MIRFPCPHCGEKFKIDDSYAGRSTKCPRCKNRITVPAVSDASAAPSATRPAAAESPAPSTTLPTPFPTPPSPAPTVSKVQPPVGRRIDGPAPSATRPSLAVPRPVPSPASPAPVTQPPPKPARAPADDADPLASLAAAASQSEHAPAAIPSPAAPPVAAAAAAALPEAAPPRPAARRPLPAHKPKREPLEPRIKILAGVLGGVLLVVLIASLLVQGNQPAVASQDVAPFALSDPPGGEKVDLAPDAAKLTAIGVAVLQYVKASGGNYPGHVGELLLADQLKPESFVSVLNKGGSGPTYTPGQDPFGPYRFGDFVFMLPVMDGTPLPPDAVIAASARSDPTGQRVIFTADGSARVVEHGPFLSIMQQQNDHRQEIWARMPAVPAKLFQ